MDNLDRNIIARLCGDLGDSLDPFGEMAVELGIPLDACWRASAAIKRPAR